MIFNPIRSWSLDISFRQFLIEISQNFQIWEFVLINIWKFFFQWLHHTGIVHDGQTEKCRQIRSYYVNSGRSTSWKFYHKKHLQKGNSLSITSKSWGSLIWMVKAYVIINQWEALAVTILGLENVEGKSVLVWTPPREKFSSLWLHHHPPFNLWRK